MGTRGTPAGRPRSYWDAWFLTAQAGTLYATFGDIPGLVDGWGGMAGVMAGLHWVKRETRFAITLNPQWATTGTDWMLFVNVGFHIRF